MARPSIFSEELATIICHRIAEGESLRSICRDEDMPDRSTVNLWLVQPDKKAFTDQYEAACDLRAENMAEELLDIADDGTNDYMERERENGDSYTVVNSEHVQRSRLRVDARKWWLSKMRPKKYGEKVDLTSGGEKIANVTAFHFQRNGDDRTDNQAHA